MKILFEPFRKQCFMHIESEKHQKGNIFFTPCKDTGVENTSLSV